MDRSIAAFINGMEPALASACSYMPNNDNGGNQRIVPSSTANPNAIITKRIFFFICDLNCYWPILFQLWPLVFQLRPCLKVYA
jgi:hypothetical protein